MKVTVIKGDITQLQVDAIVNAANSGLMGGGGVDGAIHKAGGPRILQECKEIVQKYGTCPTGEAVITNGGVLKAQWVIHTVGPVWRSGTHNEDNLLQKAYHNSLMRAEEKQLKTIAFPNISTGIYGFPKERAAPIALKAVTQYERIRIFEEIVFCCFDEENYRIYNNLLNETQYH